MKRRTFIKAMGWGAAVSVSSCRRFGFGPRRRRPNIIFILADDLGYGEPGCYGQKLILTPRLDRMAAEGMRFTQHYAGSTVCAPSRCVLMTGLHSGRCRVRGNSRGSAQALREEDTTIASLLQQSGYATALIGKWGLGDDIEGSRQGHPNRQGFDEFFGYLNQVHAHNYYPEFLWRNSQKVRLRNVVKRVDRPAGSFTGGAATERIDYSHDLFAEEALKWIEAHKDESFFLYLALTIPHANNEGSRLFGDGAEVPDYGPYRDEDWPDQDKGHAAMITRMDTDVGRLLDKLTELGIAENSLVLFSSDNGPHDESRHHPQRFHPSGPFRGMKRDLYEGGIRVPLIAWWPGTIPAGMASEHVSGFQDMLPTFAELAGISLTVSTDGISLLPVLTGKGLPRQHTHLYWEFYEQGGKQAVRWGRWKGVRLSVASHENAPIELYDLESDPGEANDISKEHPDITARIRTLMQDSHTPSRDFRFPWENEDEEQRKESISS